MLSKRKGEMKLRGKTKAPVAPKVAVEKLSKPVGVVTTFQVKTKDTGRVVHELRTTLTGPALDKIESGLMDRVDLSRFTLERVPPNVNL